MNNRFCRPTLSIICLLVGTFAACSQKQQNSDPLVTAAADSASQLSDSTAIALSAQIYYTSHEYQDASIEYGRLIQIYPQNGRFLYRKGYCLIQLDSPTAALEYFERAAKSKYQEAECYYAIGGIYAIIGADSIAITFFEKALTLEPDMEEAKSFISDVRDRNGTKSL